MTGEAESAKRYFNEVVTNRSTNHHLLRAASNGLANLWISLSEYDKAEEVFADADRKFGRGPVRSVNWDAITELSSRARLEQARHHWEDALSMVDEALAIAEQSFDTVWVFKISAESLGA